ncbi:MAG: DUF3791 domain-containing protein [Coriobacteriales bacterium]|nr:DUF3791 domain-containing protein [Coriobacteriales bacterium]
MKQTEKYQNLIIVAAIDGYSNKHGLSPSDTFKLFRRYDVFEALRQSADSLHTQSFDDSADFAEDFIARMSK